MGEQNPAKAVQFSTPAMDRMANYHCGLIAAAGGANQHYIVAQRNDGKLQVPIPQWMHCQHPSQDYVKFLAESGYPEIQKEIHHNISTRLSYIGLGNHSQENLTTSHFTTKFECMDGQVAQKDDWNEVQNNAFQPYLGSGASTPKYRADASRKRSREKAYAADRCRRLKISQRLSALLDLFPHSKEGGKAAMLDDIIENIKCLQYQMKDLCQSRLGAESSSSSFIFIEGHGHYLFPEQMLIGSLEEMMGKLLKLNPPAAMEFLHSRGLVLMPMTFAEGLSHQTKDMLDSQEK